MPPGTFFPEKASSPRWLYDNHGKFNDNEGRIIPGDSGSG